VFWFIGNSSVFRALWSYVVVENVKVGFCWWNTLGL